VSFITIWEVLNTSSGGSDHYPIIVKIGVDIHHEESSRIKRWKLEGADWDTFKKIYVRISVRV